MNAKINKRHGWPLGWLILIGTGCSGSTEPAGELPVDAGQTTDLSGADARADGVDLGQAVGPMDMASRGDATDMSRPGDAMADAASVADAASTGDARAIPDAGPTPDVVRVADATSPMGCIDDDADGFLIGEGCAPLDCDDTRADVHPGQTEVCNGGDDDCDGETDESFEGGGQLCETGLPGRCAPGFLTCALGSPACVPQPDATPLDEACNALDDDCDGEGYRRRQGAAETGSATSRSPFPFAHHEGLEGDEHRSWRACWCRRDHPWRGLARRGTRSCSARCTGACETLERLGRRTCHGRCLGGGCLSSFRRRNETRDLST